jgi:hypothetical protein
MLVGLRPQRQLDGIDIAGCRAIVAIRSDVGTVAMGDTALDRRTIEIINSLDT